MWLWNICYIAILVDPLQCWKKVNHYAPHLFKLPSKLSKLIYIKRLSVNGSERRPFFSACESMWFYHQISFNVGTITSIPVYRKVFSLKCTIWLRKTEYIVWIWNLLFIIIIIYNEVCMHNSMLRLQSISCLNMNTIDRHRHWNIWNDFTCRCLRMAHTFLFCRRLSERALAQHCTKMLWFLCVLTTLHTI